MNKQKRALAVHDISCVGKCSLTVALPILSACGIECAVLPTAVLSTHTGEFTGYTFRDLTDDINPIIDHWESLDLDFDAVYTGYLGSFAQLNLIDNMIARLGKKRNPNTLVLVDPVMGDNGRLYPGFNESFPSGMAELCKSADVIVPNITEASLLLNEPFCEGPYTNSYVQDIIRRLAEKFEAKVVLTGVYFGDKYLGAAYYDPNENEPAYYSIKDRIMGSYHGTGDIFGSLLLAALLNGKTLEEATNCAVEHTVDAILQTEPERERRFGVRFEATIPRLIKTLGL